MNEKNARPIGEFYERVYLERGAPTRDSELLRRRLGAYVQHRIDAKDHWELAKFITVETGLSAPVSGSGGAMAWVKFEDAFNGLPLIDLLKLITVVWRWLSSAEVVGFGKDGGPAYGTTWRDAWRTFVARALSEENVGYEVDERCGVHPTVDAEFQHSRAAAIAGLAAERYRGVRPAVEAAFERLSALPAEGTDAARSIFEAAESLTKLITGSGADLTEGLVEKTLRSVCGGLFSSDEQLKSTTQRLISSFAKWVSAVHPYRHGHAREHPLVLPEDVAILVVSEGAAFIRWLVELDRRISDASKTAA